MSISGNDNRGRFTKNDPRAKPFEPGASGNPGGRPKGFGPLIRDETRGGEELVEFVLLVFRKGALKHRLWAVDWLADRGYGRPVQVNHIRTLEDYRKLCTALGEKAKEVLEPEQFAKLMAGWRTIEFDAPD